MLTQEQKLNRLNEKKSQLSKFKDREFRPGQFEALDFIMRSRKMFKVIQAATGTGKSLIAMIAGMMHGRFLYLCSSKQLQIQIESEFPEVKVMWGRNNFKCKMFKELTCADCPYKGVNIDSLDSKEAGIIRKCKRNCPYEVRKREVLGSRYQVLNYTYFLFESNFVGKFSDYPVIICDEADILEKHLSSFITLRIPIKQLKVLDIDLPKYKTTKAKNWLNDWSTWAESTIKQVGFKISTINAKVNNTDINDPLYQVYQKELAGFTNLKFRLKTFLTHMDKSWLMEEVKGWDDKLKAIEFKPTWLLPELVQRFFLQHGQSFVFMSATFPPKHILAKMLGIEFEEIDMYEAKGAFPVKNRIVMLCPAGSMSYKNYEKTLPDAVKMINKILNQHPEEKGIIHTVSWKLNKVIMEIGNKRLMTHTSKNKNEMLNKFMSSNLPLVFVSPSSTRGLDLGGDKCRFSILPKMPYQGLKDKIVNARVYGGGALGQNWYESDAAQEVVQALGRANRFKTDFSISYITDTDAVNKIVDSQGLFPKYLIDAVDV